jgi:hypothetical protein
MSISGTLHCDDVTSRSRGPGLGYCSRLRKTNLSMIGLMSAGLRSESPHVTQWDETAPWHVGCPGDIQSAIFAGHDVGVAGPGSLYSTEALRRSGCRSWLGVGDEPVRRYLAARSCCRILDCSEFTIRLLVARGDLTSSARHR